MLQQFIVERYQIHSWSIQNHTHQLLKDGDRIARLNSDNLFRMTCSNLIPTEGKNGAMLML